MSIMDNIRKRMQSFLQIDPPVAMTINLIELMDFQGNAIKNRIWYRGDAYELEQLYWQIPRTAPMSTHSFWASHPTPGMEMRKIHTGLPATMVDLLAGIVSSGINDFSFGKAKAVEDLWEEHIGYENDMRALVDKCVKETLVIGDGAYKISLDPELSQYPIIEFWGGDRVEFKMKRGRIQEVIFKSFHEHSGATYELREIYGRGFIDYELFKGDNPVELTVLPEFEGLVRTEWDGNDMMAVPVLFFTSNKWHGRGQSIYDRKIDAFDSFDEAYSQWIDALRAGRTKEYIPENLLPRDPNTGKILKPNSFDNRYIRTDADMKERAENRIHTESGEIHHDSYMATYATALDLCLQGIMSPSTLGVDVKKLDNAEAQREKEKVTLYTRDTIIESLQPALEELVRTALTAYYRFSGQAEPEYEVTVSFQDYANPSFESQIETVGKGRQSGILSIEACVEELYGDDKDDEWKAEEIARLKAEQGITEMEEPAIAEDVINAYSQGAEQVMDSESPEGGGTAPEGSEEN